MHQRSLAAGLFAILASAAAAAPFDEMDYGPFISATFAPQSPKGNIVYRGVAVKFNAPIDGEVVPPAIKGKPPANAAISGIIFDQELLRYAAVWSGGYITYDGVAFNGSHGANPRPNGTQWLGTQATPGWAKSDSFADPRTIAHGPLPRDWARYKGLYRHEKGVVFKYTVGSCNVLDMPSIEVHGSQRIFCRTLNLEASATAQLVLLADLDNAKKMVNVGEMMVLDNGTTAIVGRVGGGPVGTKLLPGVRMQLTIPASDKPSQIKVCVWSGPSKDWETGAKALDGAALAPIDLTPYTTGGKVQFDKTVTTVGKRGDDKGAYTFDTLTVPFQNPYKSWMRLGGFDFFKDGRAALSTWSGDVWIVSGIDEKLEKLTWKRYAAGLHQALGLKIVDDKVYVLGRDCITRLHDLNGDGEADFYECFNNDYMVTANFHEFIFDLHTDPEGNFYFIKGGPVRPGGRGWDKVVPHHGCIFKVSKDGSKLEVVARGFRAPNGMGVGPHGEITTGDNEGTWTPTCPLNWIKPGGFYGVVDFAEKGTKPSIRDNPLCWLPRNIDNSNGGQVWITSDKFGPLSGQLLHTSYGTSTLYAVLKEEVSGVTQGGVVPLLKFDSGVCRGRFRTEENALYLTGLRGWQTNASKDAGFYRVRYTGKKAYLPTALNVAPGTIKLSFSEPLDKSIAEDADSYSLQQWNYRWTENYGSAHYKVTEPNKQGQEDLAVESASLSPDGKTVTLKVGKLQPVMQMKLQYNLKAADGAPVKAAIHNTINVVGNRHAEVGVGTFRVVEKK